MRRRKLCFKCGGHDHLSGACEFVFKDHVNGRYCFQCYEIGGFHGKKIDPVTQQESKEMECPTKRRLKRLILTQPLTKGLESKTIFGNEAAFKRHIISLYNDLYG